MLLQQPLLILVFVPNILGYSCVKGFGNSFQYCEPPNQHQNLCRCSNIQVNGTGYSDCQSIYDGTPWCYITKNSPCPDKKYSALNKMVKATFGHAAPDIYFSEQACQNTFDYSAIELPTFLPGFELRGAEKEGWLDAPTPEACEAECYALKSNCDAWTFIQSKEDKNRCRLKYGRICLNFLGARRRNAKAISGFNCVDPVGEILLPDLKIKCWATTKVTPDFCPVAGANATEFTPSSSVIASVPNPQRRSRVCYRFYRGRWRAVRRGFGRCK